MIRTACVFVLFVCVSVAAQEPRLVAEAALAAWAAEDAKTLDEVAHPEFKKHCRLSPVVASYVSDKAEKKTVLVSGSDSEVIALFCEMVRAYRQPPPSHLELFYRYIDTTFRDDLAIVVFESGLRRKSDGGFNHSSKLEVLLKQSDDGWKFLWCPSAKTWIDQLWDPREAKQPNQALVPTPASVTPAADAPVAPDAGAAHL